MTIFLLVSALGQALAQTSVDAQMNELLNSSNNIKTQFDTTLKTLYGTENLSHNGTAIPMTDFLESGKITTQSAISYNQSLEMMRSAKVQSILGEYIDQESHMADMNMHQAVDAFVNASVAVLEVVKVNEMTNDALNAGDVTSAESLQEYVKTNDVELTTTEIGDFNQSIDTVEEAVLEYSAFQVVASNEELKSELEQAAENLQATADQAFSMFYDSTNKNVIITFNQDNFFVDASVSVADLVAINNEAYIVAGEDTSSYIGGPTQNPACLLNTTNLVNCTGRSNSFGPPPNTLLYRDDGNGNTTIFAYTNEEGVIFEYAEGETVINPENGDVIGTFTGVSVVCNEGFENYCQ